MNNDVCGTRRWQKLAQENEMNDKLIERYKKLKYSRTTKRGNKYLLPPDKKDYRWGLQHFGGCEPITEKRAEKIISQMENWQNERKNKKGD